MQVAQFPLYGPQCGRLPLAFATAVFFCCCCFSCVHLPCGTLSDIDDDACQPIKYQLPSHSKFQQFLQFIFLSKAKNSQQGKRRRRRGGNSTISSQQNRVIASHFLPRPFLFHNGFSQHMVQKITMYHPRLTLTF